MPLKYFIDPVTLVKLEINKCLNEGLLSEYYPLPFLIMCASVRIWKGVPSVTQLINGTRMEYLKLTIDYAIKPSDMAFAVIGIRAHKKLESFDTDISFPEEKLCMEDITGTMDLLEQQPNGDWWLQDYKTWGSYKIAKCLGIVKTEKPLLDEEGNQILLKTGKNKGKPKQEKIFTRDSKAVDMTDAILQLNRYRMMAEEALQEPIKAMKIFAIVRDNTTYIAKSRGIMEEVYYIDVPFRDDKRVDMYFETKKNNLLLALERKIMPTICTEHECWEGRRCVGYCNVNEMCRLVGDNLYLKEETVNEMMPVARGIYQGYENIHVEPQSGRYDGCDPTAQSIPDDGRESL